MELRQSGGTPSRAGDRRRLDGLSHHLHAALDLRAERLLALLLFVIVPPAQARQP